jgi:hypothetical protein
LKNRLNRGFLPLECSDFHFKKLKSSHGLHGLRGWAGGFLFREIRAIRGCFCLSQNEELPKLAINGSDMSAGA